MKKILNMYYRLTRDCDINQLSQYLEMPVDILKWNNGGKTQFEEGEYVFLFSNQEDKDIYIVQPLDTIESVSKKLNISAEDLRERINTKYLFIGQKIEINK